MKIQKHPTLSELHEASEALQRHISTEPDNRAGQRLLAVDVRKALKAWADAGFPIAPDPLPATVTVNLKIHVPAAVNDGEDPIPYFDIIGTVGERLTEKAMELKYRTPGPPKSMLPGQDASIDLDLDLTIKVEIPS